MSLKIKQKNRDKNTCLQCILNYFSILFSSQQPDGFFSPSLVTLLDWHSALLKLSFAPFTLCISIIVISTYLLLGLSTKNTQRRTSKLLV